MHPLKNILFGDVFMSPKSLKTTFLPWFYILENDRELNLQHHFQWESRSYVKRLGDRMTEGFCDLIEHTMWQASLVTPSYLRLLVFMPLCNIPPLSVRGPSNQQIQPKWWGVPSVVAKGGNFHLASQCSPLPSQQAQFEEVSSHVGEVHGKGLRLWEDFHQQPARNWTLLATTWAWKCILPQSSHQMRSES